VNKHEFCEALERVALFLDDAPFNQAPIDAARLRTLKVCIERGVEDAYDNGEDNLLIYWPGREGEAG